MKTAIRSVATLTMMALTGIMTTSWAFAQEVYETPPTVLGTVEQNAEGVSGAGAGAGAGTGGQVAFTGFSLTVWMALLAVLVGIGLAALWAGRRRTSASKHAA
jgi:hypothetical protein